MTHLAYFPPLPTSNRFYAEKYEDLDIIATDEDIAINIGLGFLSIGFIWLLVLPARTHLDNPRACKAEIENTTVTTNMCVISAHRRH